MAAISSNIPPNFQNKSESIPLEKKHAQTSKRGAEAATEMLSRSKLMEKIDAFFCNEPGNAVDYVPYFLEKIQKNKQSIGSTDKDYETLSHKVYALYRREIIEKACKEVDANPTAWTFKDVEEWKALRATFKDFMWVYSKMVYSGAQGKAISIAMKQEFPSLPSNFWPSVNAVILPPEKEKFFPED